VPHVLAQQSTDHVGKGQESALYQSSKNTRRSWASILCCMRPAEEGFNQAANARDDASPPSRRNNPVPPPYQGSDVLPPMDPRDKGKKCLVLDLDETLVHSSFKPVPNADYIIPVEIENKVRMCRRAGWVGFRIIRESQGLNCLLYREGCLTSGLTPVPSELSIRYRLSKRSNKHLK
jgi:hypothetical protein